MYKQCWVNCTFHTQLKHSSQLFKVLFAPVKGMVLWRGGILFLKVFSFFDPHKVRDTIAIDFTVYITVAVTYLPVRMKD